MEANETRYTNPDQQRQKKGSDDPQTSQMKTELMKRDGLIETSESRIPEECYFQ
jgi:hypothetical protein